MGIVEIEAASSAQLKGVEEIVAGIRGSGIRIVEVRMGDLKDSETIAGGNSGSVCVDMVAVEEMIKGFG